MAKKNFFLAPFMSLVFTLISYFKNNVGQCCDLIFMAGCQSRFMAAAVGLPAFPEISFFLPILFTICFFWLIVSLVLCLKLSFLSLSLLKIKNK